MQVNPLWWLHARISGSTRSNWVMVAAYIAIVVVFASITARFVETPPGGRPNFGPYYAAWLGVVSGAQAVFLLLLIPGAIKKAVQRDFLTGMAESHRLTPLSSRTLVLGYLGGPAIPSLMLYLPGLLIGAYFASKLAGSMGVPIAVGGRTFVGGWLLSQGLLLVIAAMVSSISLLSAVAVREGKFNIMGLLIVGGFFGGVFAVMAVPGFALLTGAMSGSVLWNAVVGKGVALGDNAALLSSTLLQIAFTITFLTAAGRRFRAPDRPVFTLPVSLVLLGLWGTALVLGMVHATGPQPGAADLRDLHAARLGFSLISFLAVGLFVLHAAAVARLAVDRRRLFTREAAGGRWWLLSAMPVGVSVLGMLVLVLMRWTIPAGELTTNLRMTLHEPYLWAAVALALLLSCAFDSFVFYWAAASRARMWLVLLVSWGLLKVAPVLLDGMLLSFTQEMYDQEWAWYGYLTSVSPLGTIVLTMEPCWEIGFGLAVQLGLAILAGLLAWRARRQLPHRITTYTGGHTRADVLAATAPGEAPGPG